MKNLFLTIVFTFALVFTGFAQDRKPAMGSKPAKKSNVQAQGYFKNTPSNKSQDKQLKRLNDEEKRNYAPKPKPKTTTKKKSSGVIEQ